MKKITITIVLAMLCLNFWARAQEVLPKIEPLKVGDKLPESFWQQEHTIYQNGKTTIQTLAAYKGKTLLLDFWASWCGSCINRFPKLEQLQKDFGSELKIVLVNCSSTRDNEAKVNKLFTGILPPFKQYTLPSIILDNYLELNFPHRLVPNLVWIDHKGRVYAITGSAFAIAEQIKLVNAIN